MESKSSSQQFDFSDSEDSPVRPYRPITKVLKDVLVDNQTHISSSISQSETAVEVWSSTHPKESSNVDTVKYEKPCEDNNNLQERPSPAGDADNARFTKLRRSLSVSSQRKVVYMCSHQYINLCDEMLKVPGRASMVAGLIEAYRLTNLLSVVEPRAATFEDLCSFHDTEYLDFLQRLSNQDDQEKYDDVAQQYGLSYDCPAHPGVYDYAAMVSGATMQAAQSLMNDTADVVINWFGGWHHGKKDAASGFCYTNDIVLGILKLREKFSKILYVDLDLHHGDGVEDAFCSTNKVMTVSVHKHDVGFFPGTGSINDVGFGKGRYHTVNIPLRDGIRDTEFSALVCRILVKVKEQYQPDVVVCQCGADGLAGDPMESFNLTPFALGKCLYTLLSWKLPLLLLGGDDVQLP
ncbi:histone deacetylase 8-like isoform X2 [Mya arenaria]|uniref:histone deacetylase 8-like isoform X2 n=1 Tax=Mya arenaria TaxID=6604 RepID=UPI0022DEDD3D|nr:histone deacetylase 8-like isoform X2 [Mya arenaria]